jgi:capsular exopolysaccharide synthesis family protein
VFFMAERIDSGQLDRGALRRPAGGEEPIEVRRYMEALRRGLPLVLGIVAVLTVSIYIVSASLPKRYKATASIVRRIDPASDQTQSTDEMTRELNTLNALITTDGVLGAAARSVPGTTIQTLRDEVSSSVDPNANLIYVTAKDPSAVRAAAIANAVAGTFVGQEANITRRQFEGARADLESELRRVQNQPGAATQPQAIRDRLSSLGVQIATAGTDLTVAQRADVPKAQDTPRPLRNAALGIVLGLFLGVLVALGRDQLIPRPTGPRELSRLLELPVLVSVPYRGRRGGRRERTLSGIEYETYQTLAASIRFSLSPSEGPHIILVTSALHAEGKSTVTMRLGRALAHGGNRTLVVSADLRWPTLHELLDVPGEPGLAELLSTLRPESGDAARAAVSRELQHAAGQRGADLDVLPSGKKPSDPAALLSGASLDLIFDALGELDYNYVIVDAPPLLGIADTQALARRCTSLVFVARLDRISLEHVADARDTLDRLELHAVGLVVIGARGEASPYYLRGRVPAFDDA